MLRFVFVPSIVQERINSLFFVPLIVEGRIYSFRSKKNCLRPRPSCYGAEESIPRNQFRQPMQPCNRSQGMNSASLCSLAGRYDNPIPTRFLAPIDCLKILALVTQVGGINYSESIPGLLKRLQIRAQATLASGIGQLESIPRLHNMKNEDELRSSSFFSLRSCLFLE